MAKKETSASVSSIAARLLTEDPLSPREPLRQAFRDCGLPLSDSAADRLLDQLGAALAPYVADVKTVAASALSQDETPKTIDREFEAKLAAAFGDKPCTCGESKDACPVHEPDGIIIAD